MTSPRIIAVYAFLSTFPARGATFFRTPRFTPCSISIHAPREGSDFGEDIDNCPANISLSTLPARGATPRPTQPCAGTTFLSTLPARGATMRQNPQYIDTSISIHAPREGSDGVQVLPISDDELFLSTLPARGATQEHISTSCSSRDFYPRSPRGERLRLRMVSAS